MRQLFEVGESGSGLRLDEFLAGRLVALSRMRIAALLKGGAAEVNGEAAPAGLRLRAGDRVSVEAGEFAPNSMTPEPLPLEEVYEDEHLFVVVKPAGMLMHPTRGVKTGTLANALAYRLSAPDPAAAVLRPGLVHRLDRATSGLVVVAKTRAALGRLSEHFRRRLVEKRYLALLRGRVGADEMEILAPIGREEGAQPPWRVTEAGRHAETRLRVLGRRGLLTLAELEPVTGRTNQLRIHCAHVGHPVAGDEWHAADGLPRLCLHAARLAFNHPATNERMSFESPLPEEVEAVWRAAG